MERGDGKESERRWREMVERKSEGVRVGGVMCVWETERALKCVVEGEEVWVPKSVVLEESEVREEGEEGDLVVERWFGVERGWD